MPSVACSDVEYFKNDPNLIWLKDCLTFDKTTEIGYDPKTGTKKYIQVDVVPCQGDCEVQLGDPDYQVKMTEFLNEFWILARMLDSKSNFKEYDVPF